MTSEEFLDWMAFYQLQPFGPWRADTQAALVAQTIANCNAKKGHAYSINDFRLAFKPRAAKPRSMSPDEVVSFFSAMAAKQKQRGR